MAYRSNSYSGDPRWIVAKRDGVDASGNPFKRGARVFYYPRTGSILTGERAESAAADFEAARADESAW